MADSLTILWFRQDLRVRDNPALHAAIQRGPVLPVYIWSPEEEGEWAPGGASKWWLHESLTALEKDLKNLGSQLIIRRGDSCSMLLSLIKECNAQAVFWNRRYEPTIIERDTRVKAELRAKNILVESFNSSLLFEPWEILNQSKVPYKVYTPFWRACLKKEIKKPLARPKEIRALTRLPKSIPLKELQLVPKIPWDFGIKKTWMPGERGGNKELKRFLATGIKSYREGRNLPATIGTSRLSPYLHFGELSPREVWYQALNISAGESGEIYRKELVWREFAYHLLFHFPHSISQPLRPEFERFPWKKKRSYLRAWQKGLTGYPIVDAGMRELWTTGWMHNRVRMIVASFLIKDLLIPWQDGATWFWDTLVDADLASNTLGWQWTAGCGADAAPFFRIFNPTSQGEKFDVEGKYVKQWCPELKELPTKFIHRPFEAPPEMLRNAGIRLGKDYPSPIVDHAEMREEALDAFHSISSKKIGDDKKKTKTHSRTKQTKLLE